MFILKNILILTTMLILTACGGGNNSSSTIQDTAINKIKSFANNMGTVPTVQDYIDAGVIGITESNLADINQVVFNLTPEEVDTPEEIQNIANNLGVEVPIGTVLVPTTTKPTKPTTTTTVTSGDDKTVPKITLYGNNPLVLAADSNYTEFGASATDNIDGNLTANIIITGTVTTSILGTYYIAYFVEDAAGNSITSYRSVEVKDMTSPIIQLNGASSITINKDSSYTELGATATDNIDGDLTAKISINGTVDTSTIGTYTLTYTVSDTSGNTKNATRTVIVRQPRFVRDDTTSTVTDNDTGLLWDDSTIKSANWNNANTNCSSISLAGYSDWRLPTKSELNAIVVPDNMPTIDTVFKRKKADPYWTSTRSKTGYRWVISFRKPSRSLIIPETRTNYFRCVR